MKDATTKEEGRAPSNKQQALATMYSAVSIKDWKYVLPAFHAWV
jgi:hypothetical protein